MDEQESILVRNYNQAIDENFIFSSIKKGLRDSSCFKGVPNVTYYACMEPFLQDLIKTAKVLIVAKPDEPETMYSFIVYEEIGGVFVLHYLYTKQLFRKMGLARFLLKKAGYRPLGHCSHTFKTKAMEEFLAKNLGSYYNPFIHMVDFTGEPTQETEVANEQA